MKKITKKATLEYVRLQLSTNEKWATKALLTIAARQTADELASKQTIKNNHIGFGAFDAEILTSFAEQFKRNDSLSPRQMEILFKRIKHYAKQIIELSEIESLTALVANWIETQVAK